MVVWFVSLLVLSMSLSAYAQDQDNSEPDESKEPAIGVLTQTDSESHEDADHEPFGVVARPNGNVVEEVVRVSAVDVPDAFDGPVFDEVIRLRMAELRYCYLRDRVTEPELAGTVTIQFVIEPDGSVSSASPSISTLNHTRMEMCVAGRFLNMQFPQFSGSGASSSATLHFSQP